MKEESRTKNSIFNISSNFIIYIIKTILSFVVRTIFIKTLGELYLGVNGLLTNVLSMISLAELGVSSAISFSLYKPLAEKDNNKISALMSFFKSVYNIIGIIVFILGTILFLFLDKIIPEYDQIEGIGVIYFLYLINTVSTYYVAYKEILITADQKNYKLTGINVIFTILLYAIQIITLLAFKNFIIYLLVQFVIQIIQKIAINKFITKEYKDIKYNTKEKIEPNTLSDIKKNVKAMFFHKIGEYCVNGTDNIIISAFINVVTVGIYSNYLILITMINTIISMIYNNLTASFGNLLVSENKEKGLGIFNKLDFIAFILYSFSAIIFANVASGFITLWIGEEYILEIFTVILIASSFFFAGTRLASSIVRNAAGLYDKDKFIPLIQSVINLLVSVVLAMKIGINGIIIGTIVSSIIPCFYRSYILYKYIFDKNYIEYLTHYYIKYLILFILEMIISIYISSKIVGNILLITVMSGIIALFICIIGTILVFRKYEEFKYIVNVIEILLNKVKKIIKRK